MLIKLI